MKIPFAGLFGKSKERPASTTPKVKAEAPLPSVKKADGERLGKTVLPSAARAAAQAEEKATLEKPIPSETARPSVSLPVAQVSNLRTEETGKLETCPTSSRPKISMGTTVVAPPESLPPAVAIALEPNVERAISLSLADVIAQMPEGYLKPRDSFDASRAILVRAAEVEKGMATGRPAISVAALFQQAPDIFMHTVPATDGAMVALPFERVIRALSSLRQRRDQGFEQAVPEVETPFLQVTKEDTERFGVTLPVQPAGRAQQTEATTETERPVRIEPASAQAFAAAVPEAAESFVPPVREPSDDGDELEDDETRPGESREAMRIPFTPPSEPEPSKQFGTGEPAFPRVPASSGPPVPSAPATDESRRDAPTVQPARISFSFPAPSDEVSKPVYEEKAEGGRRKDEAEKPNIALQPPNLTEDGGTVLTLPLRPILQALPPMQLGGNPATVPAEATVSFPMSIIAPQLASGKVVVKPNAFYAVLPEQFRKLFLEHAIDAPVQLPLAQVLANLPGETLRLRDDQEIHAPEESFDTPFAAKAAEDAVRFGGNAEKPKTESRQTETASAEKVEQPASDDSKFDAKQAVAKACALEGVDACSVNFADGLNIAGNIPESMQLDGLSAMAPTLLQKIGKHMLQTSLGAAHCFTVYGESAPVSFFAIGDICLTALHRAELNEAARRELARITAELSHIYSETAQMG